MKKCPYCAELIQDEAIVCRFCNRDLVENVERIAYNRKLQSFKENVYIGLSLDEMTNLSQEWIKTYSDIPKDGLNTVKPSMVRVVGLLTPIIGKYYDYKIINKSELQLATQNQALMGMSWAYLCFGIGGEVGRKSLSNQDAPYILFTISKPFRDFMINWLGKMPKFATQQEIINLAETIDNEIISASVKIANIGFVYGSAFKLNDGMEPFASKIKYLSPL